MQYLTNLWNALDFGSLESILLRLTAVFLCLTIHETCHGLAAYALGDPTAKRAHRLSLNPLRHIDWIGFVMMIVAVAGIIYALEYMERGIAVWFWITLLGVGFVGLLYTFRLTQRRVRLERRARERQEKKKSRRSKR